MRVQGVHVIQGGQELTMGGSPRSSTTVVLGALAMIFRVAFLSMYDMAMEHITESKHASTPAWGGRLVL